MQVDPTHVKQLIEMAADKFGLSVDHYGLRLLAAQIPPGPDDPESGVANLRISKQYLYRSYCKAVEAIKAGEPRIKNYDSHLTVVARAIGRQNFREFIAMDLRPIEPQLRAYTGLWWSLAKASWGNFILKAPVKIHVDEKMRSVRIEMKGGRKLFSGRVVLRQQNICCELDTTTDKALYMVMRIGALEKQRMLKGVFAGMSSFGDPICGREVLVREEKEPYDQMSWKKLALKDARSDKSIDRAVLEYLYD